MGSRSSHAVVQTLFALLVAALAIVGCGGAVETTSEPGVEPAAEPAVAAPAEYAQPPLTRINRWRDPRAMQLESHPTGAHLTYFGGRVVSNIQIVEVLYGAGTYASFVSGTSSPSLATFYGGVTNSAYLDWLTEYNTPVSGGTNQHIGRGTFGGQFTITPSLGNDGSTIDDSNIQAELVAQINASNLPAPKADAAGNDNTLYMIHFPLGKSITLGGSGSCVSGGFCAYHGTVSSAAGPGGKEIYYGVLPDMESGTGCDVGCGGGKPFDNQTSVASHEMVETITDCEVGLATVFGPPLAWYDQNLNEEIGDLCNAQQGSVVGGDGVTYTVQQEFSNVANNCIVTRTVANDFSIAVSPGSLSVKQGANGSTSVNTAIASGLTESVALSISGLPSGASAAFSPTPVNSGSSSSLTITVGASTAPGTYTLSVKGTATSGSHTVLLTLTVTSSTTTSDFRISVSPASLSVRRGRIASDTVSTAIASGSSESIALSVGGLPSGTTASFSPGSVSSGGSSTLTLHVGSSTARGTYTLTVTGTATSGSHSTFLTLTAR